MNKAFLVGRLTKDPELKYTNKNTAVCNFTLAVNRRFSEETDFIPIVAWGNTSEFCSKYFTKGRKVIVIGRIQVRSWEDDTGNKRYTTEVVAEEVDFADSKKNDNNYVTDLNLSGADGFYPMPGEEDDELPF